MKKCNVSMLFAGLVVGFSCYSQEAAVSNEVSDASVSEAEKKPLDAKVFGAALDGKVEIVQKALSAGSDVNALDEQGRTMLMFAAYNGHEEIVRLLIKSGADVNMQDTGGATALMFAASGPYKSTVELLLDSGAEINVIDSKEHFSALMYAGAEGQLEVVNLLLERGANPSLKDVDGDTAASFARNNAHYGVAEVLQKALAKRNKDESTNSVPAVVVEKSDG